MGTRRRFRRVLLVTPPYHCGMVESAGVWMPLGLAYLAGSLQRAGYDAAIYDAMSLFHDDTTVLAGLASACADVVAVTAHTSSVNAALRVLRAAKLVSSATVTVIGGVHPTFMAEEVLADPAVDFVVRGEGEHALPDLLACLEAGDDPAKVAGVSFRDGDGVRHAPQRPLHADLDALPVAWELIDWPTYHYRTKPGSRLAIASWSRGCVERCTFCSQQLMWRHGWRGRSVEAIVDEAAMLVERFGVDTLEVADEYPTNDRHRWEEILDRLIEADLGVELLVETRAADIVRDEDILGKYREAGVLHMYVGVETPRQDRLDGMRKNLAAEDSKRAIELLNEAGIISETSFLLGFPDETPETIGRTLEAAFDYDPDLAFFIALTPWPYAELYPQVAHLVEEHDYSRYNLATPIMRSEEMSREELGRAMGRCFGAFYGRKMQRLDALAPHKRAYLRSVTKLLMEESYLAEEVVASLGQRAAAAPAGVRGPAAAAGGAAAAPGATERTAVPVTLAKEADTCRS